MWHGGYHGGSHRTQVTQFQLLLHDFQGRRCSPCRGSFVIVGIITMTVALVVMRLWTRCTFLLGTHIETVRGHDRGAVMNVIAIPKRGLIGIGRGMKQRLVIPSRTSRYQTPVQGSLRPICRCGIVLTRHHVAGNTSDSIAARGAATTSGSEESPANDRAVFAEIDQD